MGPLASQIYLAVYSDVDVYEMEVNKIAVMRRCDDNYLNATQILKVAGIDKAQRSEILKANVRVGEYETKISHDKYQGMWVKFEKGQELCRQFHVDKLLQPLLTYRTDHQEQSMHVQGTGTKGCSNKRLASESDGDAALNSQPGLSYPVPRQKRICTSSSILLSNSSQDTIRNMESPTEANVSIVDGSQSSSSIFQKDATVPPAPPLLPPEFSPPDNLIFAPILNAPINKMELRRQRPQSQRRNSI